ncbi:MAG: hypothetical protein O7C56_08545, partial [Rickettsia endosymbiont of Ixodes persulcatus]|nr:hypothetical protein [Rickettsia endosymbiont of Ixodes persulcatus]
MKIFLVYFFCLLRCGCDHGLDHGRGHVHIYYHFYFCFGVCETIHYPHGHKLMESLIAFIMGIIILMAGFTLFLNTTG